MSSIETDDESPGLGYACLLCPRSEVAIAPLNSKTQKVLPTGFDKIHLEPNAVGAAVGLDTKSILVIALKLAHDLLQ